MVDSGDRERLSDSAEECALMQRELMSQAKVDGKYVGPMVM
jgi:hypothetical protein